MSMSYIMVGRRPPGTEIVALFDSQGRWEVLTEGVAGNPEHEDLMASVVEKQLAAQTREIAIEIRSLENR